VTISVLRPTDPHSDVFYEGGFSTDEPTITVVGGSECLADDSDSTYVSVLPSGTYPVLSSPRFSAHVPPLRNVKTINNITMRWRFRSVPVTGTVTGYIYARMQLFVWLHAGPISYPYDQGVDTITLAQQELSGVDASDWREESLTFDYFDEIGEAGYIAALNDGRLYMRWQFLPGIGDVMDQWVSEASLVVDYVRAVRPPLRQWPRDDGLRRNPARTSPTSRQGSLRRGPVGNYI